MGGAFTDHEIGKSARIVLLVRGFSIKLPFYKLPFFRPSGIGQSSWKELKQYVNDNLTKIRILLLVNKRHMNFLNSSRMCGTL